MNVVIFNWRDTKHPRSGGAEIATQRLAESLSARGHKVTWFSSSVSKAADEEHGAYTIIRRGSEITCRVHALVWLWKHRDIVDLVIDEVNTLPFFSRIVARNKVVVWMHQLAREVWLAEAPPLIGHLGYLLERVSLGIYKNSTIITISRSSANSFRKFGMRGRIHVCELGLNSSVEPASPRVGRIGYVGRIAKSKRVHHMIMAMREVRKTVPDAELIIVGSGDARYVSALERMVRVYGLQSAVKFVGKVSNDQRDSLMRSFDVLTMASLREGWGLVVSEAARFRVPSVAYPVPGLVDSVVNEHTGIVTKGETPHDLATAIVSIILDRQRRNQFGEAAAENLRRYTDERFIERFESILFDEVERAKL